MAARGLCIILLAKNNFQERIFGKVCWLVILVNWFTLKGYQSPEQHQQIMSNMLNWVSHGKLILNYLRRYSAVLRVSRGMLQSRYMITITSNVATKIIKWNYIDWNFRI